MTTPYFFGLLVGTLAGVLGTLTVLAIHRWFEGHPKPLDMDDRWRAVKRL